MVNISFIFEIFVFFQTPCHPYGNYYEKKIAMSFCKETAAAKSKLVCIGSEAGILYEDLKLKFLPKNSSAMRHQPCSTTIIHDPRQVI